MKPILKGRQHLDEKYIPMKLERDHYDLNCIDSKTKYITAHLFVEKRTFQKCVDFLNQIKITCYDQMLKMYEQNKKIIFVSDGFENYRNAFNKLFFRVAKLTFGVPISYRKYGLEHNNNPIERENGNIKDRLKIMRGGFGSFQGAEGFLNMRRVIHNFVNPHQGLKERTPAEEANINLKLKRNKLLKLIQEMAKKKHHSLR